MPATDARRTTGLDLSNSRSMSWVRSLRAEGRPWSAWPFWHACAHGPARGHAGENRVSQFVQRFVLPLSNQLREKFHHPPHDSLGRPSIIIIREHHGDRPLLKFFVEQLSDFTGTTAQND